MTASFLRTGFLSAATGLLVGSAPCQQPAKPPVSLGFGVYTTDKPTVMYRTFLPVIEAMQQSMEQLLDREVRIEIRIFPTYAGARSALVEGKIDFARFGPASYVLAKAANPDIGLLAMETVNGSKQFKGYIVVRSDSEIRNLSQLRGKRFAFGDATSTIGRYLAQESLLAAGIYLKDLKVADYLGRHDKVFRAVQLKDFDAGALKSSTFVKLNKKNQLRVLASFDNVTKPWVCRANLAPKLREAMTTALHGIRDKEALRHLKADSLVSSSDKDYDPIRRSMQAAEKFAPRAAKATEKPASARPGKD